MNKTCIVLIIINIFGCFAAVLDKEAHRSSSNRVLQQKPLSDAGHNGDGDYEYDHEAFLGEEYGAQFDELSPEESQRRLTILLEKIDLDQDGLIVQEELEVWIRKVEDEEVGKDTKIMWEEKVPPGQHSISWEQFRNRTYGFAEDNDSDTYFPHGFNFTGMINRDERRFKLADRDNDGSLTQEEFKAFVHPEEVSYMKEVIIQETMDDMDTDHDGKISINEYLNDLWKGPAEEEPDWVKEERKTFSEQRDHDKDGFLNFNEVKEWIVPDNIDLVLAEAHHLVVTVDADMDGKLTRDEILDRYDVFVGSQATQYGDLLNRHDEF